MLSHGWKGQSILIESVYFDGMNVVLFPYCVAPFSLLEIMKSTVELRHEPLLEQILDAITEQ